MAPVDGGNTLQLTTIIRVLKRLKSSVVIPMYWFGSGTLDTFVAGMSDEVAVNRLAGPSIGLSLRSLPDRPTVVVLQPEWLNVAQ
jgi:hypothetical protein